MRHGTEDTNPSLCNLRKTICSHWYKHVFSVLRVPMGRSFAWPHTCSEATHSGLEQTSVAGIRHRWTQCSTFHSLLSSLQAKYQLPTLRWLNQATTEFLHASAFPPTPCDFFQQGTLSSLHESSSLEHLPPHHLPNFHCPRWIQFHGWNHSWSLELWHSRFGALFHG